MRSSWLNVGHWLIVSMIFTACTLLELEARHYVLIRRVYAGEEGRAMLEKDESSRLLGWPLGVSSEVALLDSAPIFRAVVEKDPTDSSNNEVSAADSGEVSRPPPLQSGRSAPRRVEEDSSSETRKSEISVGDNVKGQANVDSGSSQVADRTTKQPKGIDIHNHEPDTAESHGSNSTQGKSAAASSEKSGSGGGSGADDEDLESINIEDIEKIMARHKIRIMGATHPMAKIALDQERAESVSGEQVYGAVAPPHHDSEQHPRTNEQADSSHSTKKGAVPEQVMRIAEWLLNQTP